MLFKTPIAVLIGSGGPLIVRWAIEMIRGSLLAMALLADDLPLVTDRHLRNHGDCG